MAAEGGGGGEEEEELEWLSNKDAFPGLETSFEIPTHSRSSSGGGTGSSSSAATAAEGARPSPVSVLAVAAPSRVPVRPRSKGRRRRRRVLAGLSPAVAATEAKERRRCRHCEAEETPQWRAGPEGPKTLCNACGVRYKSGRLVPEYRPAASPTFSAAIHSNPHRRIMEMRRHNSARGRRTGRPPATPLVAGSAL